MTPGLCEAEEGRIDFERFALKIESESLFLREDVRVRCGFFPDIASGTGGGAAGVDAFSSGVKCAAKFRSSHEELLERNPRLWRRSLSVLRFGFEATEVRKRSPRDLCQCRSVLVSLLLGKWFRGTPPVVILARVSAMSR
ncbi:hypothetical protein B296_00055660 [Ensete ventricosum]|uniref:Uncharacterized protein n=1 Tax=Ensete ventricosum TaxID=4639 RepID=A0A426XYS2_ENSVE|nr:hypothetical protein B296_00055660 [Ensete ventricosum]